MKMLRADIVGSPVNRQSRTSFLGVAALISRLRKHSGFPRFSLQEAVMTKLREKAQARTMQIVGQMIGDNQLVEEGKERERQAEKPAGSSGDHSEPPRETDR
jgi:hypothetical protein